MSAESGPDIVQSKQQEIVQVRLSLTWGETHTTLDFSEEQGYLYTEHVGSMI